MPALEKSKVPVGVEVASLLDVLGSDVTGAIMAHLEPEAVAMIERGRAEMPLGKNHVAELAAQFVTAFSRPVPQIAWPTPPRQRTIVPGEADADPKEAVSEETATARVASADPRVIADLLAPEHPQAVAVVLATLPAPIAAALAAALPLSLRAAAMARLSNLNDVAADLVEAVFEALSQALDETQGGSSGLDGRGRAVELLALNSQGDRAELMQAVEQGDPEAAARLRMLFASNAAAAVPSRKATKPI